MGFSSKMCLLVSSFSLKFTTKFLPSFVSSTSASIDEDLPRLCEGLRSAISRSKSRLFVTQNSWSVTAPEPTTCL